MNITKKVIVCLAVFALVGTLASLFFAILVCILVAYFLPGKKELLTSEELEIIFAECMKVGYVDAGRNAAGLIGRELTLDESEYVFAKCRKKCSEDALEAMELLRYNVVELLLYHEMTPKEFKIFLDRCHKEEWFGNAREMVEFLKSKFKSELTQDEIGIVFCKCEKEGWSEGAWGVVKSLS